MSSRPYFLFTFVCLALSALVSCGTPGAPQPPSLRVPKPVDDLTAMRKGGQVLLTWTPPTQTTDGENLKHVGTTEVCRGVNDFPMIHCDEKVATLNDAQVEHWTKGTMAARKDYTDTLPASLETKSPLEYATYALNDLNPNGKSGGLSKQVRVPLAPTLVAPAGLAAKVTAEGVVLSWTGVKPEVANPALHYFYRVFRRSATDDQKPELIAGEVAVADEETSSFVDRNIEWEQNYAYRVAGITQIQQPGKEAVEVMDPNVRDKILSRPRAKEWLHWEQKEPTLHEVRQKYGAQLSDEDLILHYFAGEDYVKALPDHGKPKEYIDATQPLVKIIEQLSKRKDSNQVYIERPGFTVRMERRAGT